MEKHILTINAGSSSIKFALFATDALCEPRVYGRIERIGLSDSVFVSIDALGNEVTRAMHIPDMHSAIDALTTFLDTAVDFQSVVAIGHRIVHGMDRASHEVVTPTLLVALKKIAPIDPEHLPTEIAIVEMFANRFPNMPQVACFDTVFHQTMPRVAKLLALPRRYDTMGIRRYGFHGLSCESIMETLRVRKGEMANGRIVILHLGSGASVTAVSGGKSIDTSMGFTPASGIPMSTRVGDVDAGALCYIMGTEGHTAEKMSHIINHESGLLGISEMSADMHDLLEREETDIRAKEAIDHFCYEVKKRIGAYAASVGGIDVLVFAGGMGERAPRIRARICDGLAFLGITLDDGQNNANAEHLGAGAVAVEVVHTDEERTMAHITQKFIHN